jgi:hypothetical protein
LYPDSGGPVYCGSCAPGFGGAHSHAVWINQICIVELNATGATDRDGKIHLRKIQDKFGGIIFNENHARLLMHCLNKSIFDLYIQLSRNTLIFVHSLSEMKKWWWCSPRLKLMELILSEETQIETYANRFHWFRLAWENLSTEIP